MQAHDVHVEEIKRFQVCGDQIEAAFVVGIAALKWSKARADTFVGALHEHHSDLLAYQYEYERIPDESEMLRPTTVERIGFAWRREIRGPEPREKVEAEFAARRQVVLSMLSDQSSGLESS